MTVQKKSGNLLKAPRKLFEKELFWHFILRKQKLYLYYIELVEIGLFTWIKMELALNNQPRLMCHKTKTKKNKCIFKSIVD